eukprot:Plantae.Rhodophyta-Hildenbrandia_rubra.ctg5923.p1 GENE.Plantae.Rhodophyta-Hildenbrandia_rubra.ctg5923~~Plantae.Rhodophyta-Hildenbrandia_rubra.ctg5923.p1  ORF type:complete len:411 (-),score=82.39 Plantae.Rhodophyta-Hildenbrandia_rubra.ctg5923:382-1614(-)
MYLRKNERTSPPMVAFLGPGLPIRHSPLRTKFCNTCTVSKPVMVYTAPKEAVILPKSATASTSWLEKWQKAGGVSPNYHVEVFLNDGMNNEGHMDDVVKEVMDKRAAENEKISKDSKEKEGQWTKEMAELRMSSSVNGGLMAQNEESRKSVKSYNERMKTLTSLAAAQYTTSATEYGASSKTVKETASTSSGYRSRWARLSAHASSTMDSGRHAAAKLENLSSAVSQVQAQENPNKLPQQVMTKDTQLNRAKADSSAPFSTTTSESLSGKQKSDQIDKVKERAPEENYVLSRGEKAVKHQRESEYEALSDATIASDLRKRIAGAQESSTPDEEQRVLARSSGSSRISLSMKSGSTELSDPVVSAGSELALAPSTAWVAPEDLGQIVVPGMVVAFVGLCLTLSSIGGSLGL